MDFVEFIAKFLAFRTIPTTVVIFLVYLVVLGATLLTDLPGSVPRPKYQRGLNITQAYGDLHAITRYPHPYNSHANDLARSYILERITNITNGYEHIEVDNDLRSNGSWAQDSLYGPSAVYFEGTNILVKIEGTRNDADSDAVLFSAHYDSVSTAPGATDDGMGVVTLLQMVEYLAQHRPQRTAVFNINNGEEDWLNGAHAFLQHPWSKLTRTFLNLEGAASGGRPLLFRATSTAPLRSFRGSRVAHPHANVLSADAFSRDVIRSGTDYSVYDQAGLDGIDLAFYKGRSKYHTKYDTIPHFDSEQRSLWAMMDAARGSGLALLNEDATHEQTGSAVYFDVFGYFFVLISLNNFIVYNICLAILGPALLLGMRIAEIVIQRDRRLREDQGLPERERTWGAHIRSWYRGRRWFNEFWTLSKFFFALAIAVILQALLGLGYVNLNPYVVHSQPYLVALSSFSLAYLSLYSLLNFPLTFARYGIVPAESSKHITLLQTYSLTWILLLLTLFIPEAGVHDNYLINIWNTVLFLGCVVSCLEVMFGAEGTFFRYRRAQEVNGLTGEETAIINNRDEPPTENTPLIPRIPVRSAARAASEDQGGAIAWWLLQLLIVVPIPLALLAHVGVLLLSAMGQALTDGGNPDGVYTAIFAICFLLVVPIAPFTFRLHRFLAYLMLLVFILTTAYTWLVFPFSSDAPFKVMFRQVITLQTEPDFPYSTTIRSAVTTLTGLEAIVKNDIIPALPSAVGKNVDCVSSVMKPGLHECSWESDLIPDPGHEGIFPFPRPYSIWLSVEASTGKHGNETRFEISGLNSRNCRLYFENHNVRRYRVDGSDGTMQPDYPVPEKGTPELRLWSRTWGREFVVHVEPQADSDGVAKKTLKGRAACEWNEYESGSTGIGTGGKIPALEEVLMWLPKWAAVMKSTDGLVEVVKEFEV